MFSASLHSQMTNIYLIRQKKNFPPQNDLRRQNIWTDFCLILFTNRILLNEQTTYVYQRAGISTWRSSEKTVETRLELNPHFAKVYFLIEIL